jgi:hypothetical protein
MQVFLGRRSLAESWAEVATAMLWVLGLIALAQLIQWRGMRQLSISGG